MLHTETNSPERQERKELTAWELVSNDAARTLDEYCAAHPEEAEQARNCAEHTVLLLADFAKEFVDEPERQYLFDAALLSTLVTSKESARTNVRAYFNPESEQADWNRIENTAIVLGDLRVLIGMTEKLYTDANAATGTVLQDELPGVEEPDKNPWLRQPDVYDADVISDMTSKVGREAFLLQAVRLIRSLKDYETQDPQVTLRAIADIESLFAPVSEVIGYDGLAMLENCRAARVRLDTSGQQDTIDTAEEYYDEMFGPDRKRHLVALDLLFGRIGFHNGEQGILVVPAVTNYSNDHEVVFGEVAGQLSEGEEDAQKTAAVVGTYRIKTLESFVRKVIERRKRKSEQKNVTEDIIPMDMLGVTLIVQNEEAAADTLRMLINQIGANLEEANGPFRYQKSPSREQAVQVRGNDAYRALVAERAGVNPATTEFKPDGDDGYQVSKVTLTIQTDPTSLPIRTEIQILTKAARENSRYGLAMHFFHKRGMHETLTPEEKRSAALFMAGVHEWGKEEKKDMSQPRIFALQSILHGRKFMELFRLTA